LSALIDTDILIDAELDVQQAGDFLKQQALAVSIITKMDLVVGILKILVDQVVDNETR